MNLYWQISQHVERQTIHLATTRKESDRTLNKWRKPFCLQYRRDLVKHCSGQCTRFQILLERLLGTLTQTMVFVILHSVQGDWTDMNIDRWRLPTDSGMHDEGGRRASTRAKGPPLRWWCGDKKTYERVHRSTYCHASTFWHKSIDQAASHAVAGTWYGTVDIDQGYQRILVFRLCPLSICPSCCFCFSAYIQQIQI